MTQQERTDLLKGMDMLYQKFNGYPLPFPEFGTLPDYVLAVIAMQMITKLGSEGHL